MKNKKLIASVLAIGLLASCFGGVKMGFAQDSISAMRDGIFEDNSMTSSLPKVETKDAKADVKSEADVSAQEIVMDQKEEVLYEGTNETIDPDAKDLYDISDEDIENLMYKGYTVEDIFEADKIANEIGIAPEELLEKKDDTDKSLKQVRDDLLKQCSKEKNEKLKEKYKEEYEELKDAELDDDEAMEILNYTDIQGTEVTKELITSYKEKGSDSFKENEKSTKKKIKAASKSTNNEYEVSDEQLSEKLKMLAKKTGKSVDELTESYNEDILGK